MGGDRRRGHPVASRGQPAGWTSARTLVTLGVSTALLAGFVARGSTVFLTSHVLEIVERLCTHVGIIVRGELVEQGALESIRRSGSLEECFLERVGADPEATRKLNWLEEAAP